MEHVATLLPFGVQHCQHRFTKILRFGINWYKSEVFEVLGGKYLPPVGKNLQTPLC